MAERPTGADRAVLVQVDFDPLGAEDRLHEFEQLARSAGAEVSAVVRARRERPDAALFVGRGKAAEVAAQAQEHGAQIVLVNHSLSGAQERNLERELSCRVVDRVGLILDIFAQRARSAEGKLQVELAQLDHLATRLVRGWTHLERQKGGIGMRGPGETQLETDRRLIGQRIRLLKERLGRVARQRATQRRSRLRNAVRSVALVGYTNAGKSTLFNRLTGAGSYAADQLFATLDTTVRRLRVPGAQPIVLSDTVGFVRDLPHELVAAFRGTLTEALESDLLLHVVDASQPDRDEQIAAVEAVLSEIGAQDIPRITVLNKIDRAGLDPGAERDECGNIRTVRVSAARGEGCERLIEAIANLFPRTDSRPAFAAEA